MHQHSSISFLLLVTNAQGSSLALHTLPGWSYLFPRLHISIPNSDFPLEFHMPNQMSTVLLHLVDHVIFNTSKIKSIFLCIFQTPPSVIYPITVNSQKLTAHGEVRGDLRWVAGCEISWNKFGMSKKTTQHPQRGSHQL